jgi:hypothetical protein
MEKTLEDLVERLLAYWSGCDRVRGGGDVPPHIEFLLNDLHNYYCRTRGTEWLKPSPSQSPATAPAGA